MLVAKSIAETVARVAGEGFVGTPSAGSEVKLLTEQDLNKRVNDNIKGLGELESVLEDLIQVQLRVKRAKFDRERALEDKAKAEEALRAAEKLDEKFRLKYEEKQEEHREFDKAEAEQRKKMIDEYHNKVEEIKREFEESVQRKEEQIKFNEELRQQCDKQQTDTLTSEAIKEAQFKKKQLENYLEEATLKQRAEIMEKYREINVEMVGKIKVANEMKQKVRARANALGEYDQKYKEATDEFHSCLQGYKLQIEHYRKVISKGKKENQALENRLKGNETTLASLEMEQRARESARKDAENQLAILGKILSQLQ